MKRIRDFSIFHRLNFCEPLALVTSHHEGKSNVLAVGKVLAMYYNKNKKRLYHFAQGVYRSW